MEKIAYVPVSFKHLSNVVALIEELEQKSEQTACPTSDCINGWTTGELRRLWMSVKDQPFVAHLIPMLVGNPNVSFYFSELTALISLLPRSARGQMSAFSRRLKKIHADGKWPLYYRQEADGQLRYWVDDATADCWRAAMGQ